MKIAAATLLLLLLLVLGVAFAQEYRFLNTRRDVAMDRQALFHGRGVFHVVTMLRLAPGQALLSGVGEFVQAAESAGAEIIYAGKVVVNARRSRQLPGDEWDAVVLTQYPSRQARDAGRAELATARARFAGSYALGMKRSAALNLALPLILLAKRVGQIISRTPPRFPFTPAEIPPDVPAQALAQLDQFVARMRANTELGRDALVVVNFSKDGDADQRAANAQYGNEMLEMMAETGAGPTHFGEAVTLEGEAAFDQVIIVFYPGVQFFADMAVSEFFTRIVGGKQPGDDLASLTVPLLPHL